jgi:hypothetical protein
MSQLAVCDDLKGRDKMIARFKSTEPNKAFENVAESKYFGMALTDHSCIHSEVKSRLNSGNAYYHAVQNLVFLSSV